MSNVYGQTLLDDMAQQQGLPMTLVKQAAQEILVVIREGLIADGVVNVSNFGTFRLKSVAARNGFNPQTRERIIIPAHQRVVFSPCKALRELIEPVHRPPIPIREEEQAPRAAARSASIAANTVIASKTITPPAPAPAEKPEPAIDTSAPAPQVQIEPVRPSVESRLDEVTHTTTPFKEEQNVKPEPPVEELGEEDVIPLEIEGDRAAEQKSNRSLQLGAAAAIVIAIVTLSLYFGDTTDELTPPPPIAEDVAVTEQTPPSESASTGLPPAGIVSEVPPGTATTEAQTEAREVSALHEEIPKAEPEIAQSTALQVEPTSNKTAVLTPSTGGDSVNNQGTSMEVQPAVTAEAKPGVFFFSEKVHTITHGESLWRLARRHYQEPLLWPHIYQANAAVIDNPDSLRVGSDIVIPSIQGAPGKLTKTDRRNIAEGYYLTYLYYKNSGHKDAFFALLEAKRYDNKVVEEHRSLLQLSKVEEILLGQQQTMPF